MIENLIRGLKSRLVATGTDVEDIIKSWRMSPVVQCLGANARADRDAALGELLSAARKSTDSKVTSLVSQYDVLSELCAVTGVGDGK